MIIFSFLPLLPLSSILPFFPLFTSLPFFPSFLPSFLLSFLPSVTSVPPSLSSSLPFPSFLSLPTFLPSPFLPSFLLLPPPFHLPFVTRMNGSIEGLVSLCKEDTGCTSLLPLPPSLPPFPSSRILVSPLSPFSSPVFPALVRHTPAQILWTSLCFCKTQGNGYPRHTQVVARTRRGTAAVAAVFGCVTLILCAYVYIERQTPTAFSLKGRAARVTCARAYASIPRRHVTTG